MTDIDEQRRKSESGPGGGMSPDVERNELRTAGEDQRAHHHDFEARQALGRGNGPKTSPIGITATMSGAIALKPPQNSSTARDFFTPGISRTCNTNLLKLRASGRKTVTRFSWKCPGSNQAEDRRLERK